MKTNRREATRRQSTSWTRLPARSKTKVQDFQLDIQLAQKTANMNGPTDLGKSKKFEQDQMQSNPVEHSILKIFGSWKVWVFWMWNANFCSQGQLEASKMNFLNILMGLASAVHRCELFGPGMGWPPTGFRLAHPRVHVAVGVILGHRKFLEKSKDEKG